MQLLERNIVVLKSAANQNAFVYSDTKATIDSIANYIYSSPYFD